MDFVRPKEQGATRDTQTRPTVDPEAEDYDLRMKAVVAAFKGGNLKPYYGISGSPFTVELAVKLGIQGQLAGIHWKDWLKSEEDVEREEAFNACRARERGRHSMMGGASGS